MMYLKRYNIHIEAFTTQIGAVKLEKPFYEYNLKTAKESPLHCPDNETAQKMLFLLNEIVTAKDTIGCTVGCMATGVPVGLGEPVFEKLSANLAKAMLSINAAKGFEYGSGFNSANKKGSEINDLYTDNFRTQTNFSGGIQAGISNGNLIYFSVPFKPLSSIMQDQQSIDTDGNICTLKVSGRHDICAAPRVLPVVEAMTALTLADHFLRNKIMKPSCQK